MAALELKVGDTYPPVTGQLSDSNGFIDLTNATGLTFYMSCPSPLTNVTGACTIKQVPFTATTNGTNQLTSVSTFTGLVVGQTLSLAAGGIPASATITALNPGGSSLTMSAPATTSLSAQAFIANQGGFIYTWGGSDTAVAGNYTGEVKITWSGGGIQRVPNTLANNFTITIYVDVP